MIKKQIPNIITSFNLLCGSLSIYFLYNSPSLVLPSILILLGGVFDLFDGMVARMLGVGSEMGKQLDSLADMISFGLAPSLIAISIIAPGNLYENPSIGFPFLFIPLLMAIMSGFRLAKFNIDDRQTTEFLGVPTPANAMIWAGIPIIHYLETSSLSLWGFGGFLPTMIHSFLINPKTIIVLSIILSILLIVELPLLSLKFRNMSWKENKSRYVFIIISLFLIFALNFYAIPLMVLVYIILSLIVNTNRK